ncbi:MAG: hypothetical protein IKG18_00955 [Atopobiaceae bacterium]|nr:hypothetical protein [Atopobiaceae bacterium]
MPRFENTALTRRQMLWLAGGGLASLALVACGGKCETAEPQTVTPEETEVQEPDVVEDVSTEGGPETAGATGKSMVVYFSWSGNTRSMAERIARASGADVWELVPEEPYPEDYDACTDEALAEQRAGTLRAYQGDVDGWDSVETVFLGYPIWWMDLPQITKAFVADHDWAGKTVVPFCSYYSSGWTGTPETLAETCGGATMLEGIALAQGDLPGALDDIDGWYASLSL